MIRTDLVIESFDAKKLDENGGIRQKEEEFGGIKITRVSIESKEGERRTGKPKGDYVTVQVPPLGENPGHSDEETEKIAGELAKLLPETGDVLVAGLGNAGITPDAVGPLTCEKVIATRHLPPDFAGTVGISSLRGVAVLAPGVLGQTGIETAEILASVCQRIRPACVVAIDALAARDAERLGTTLQFASTGIFPGSGVQNRRAEISLRTLGVPVVSIGVPTVIDIRTVLHQLGAGEKALGNPGSTMVVTPQDVDLIVAHAAGILGQVINRALQPGLGLGDIAALM